MLSKFIYNITHSGVHSELSNSTRRSVVVSNQIALTLSIFGLCYNALFYNDPGAVFGISTLASLLWCSIFLNKIRWYEISRALLLFFITIGLVVLVAYVSPLRPDYVLPPRMVLIGIVGIPLMIFDIREKFWLTFGIGMVIISFIIYDPIHHLIGRKDLILMYPDYIYDIAGCCFAFVTLIFSFFYFKYFTYQTEFHIDELLLEQANTQEELRQTNEDLFRINAVLTAKNVENQQQILHLAESEIRYQSLADATLEGVLMHINGQIVGCNRSFGQMFGYLTSEVIGKSITDFVRKEDYAQVRSVFLANSVSESEAIGKKKDGNEFQILLFSHNNSSDNNTRIAIFRDVSQYKLMEMQLRQSQGNLRAVIDNTEDPIWSVDRNLNIVLTNNRFQTLYFNTYGHWIRPGDSIIQSLPPASKGLWKSYYLRALDGATLRIEFDFRQDSVYQLVFNPIYDERTHVQGVAVFAQDITERKKAETERQQMQESLSESRANLYALIENTKELIWSVNLDYEIILMNTSVRETLFRRDGSPMKEGDNILNNVPRDKVSLWENYYDHALSGESFKVEHQFYGKITNELTFSPIVNERFEITGVAVFAHDISNRKQYEEELLGTNKQLARALNDLQTTQRQLLVNEKLAAVGQLVASIAHEINSPLGAIMSFNRHNHHLAEEVVAEVPTVLRNIPDAIMPPFLQLIESSEDNVLEMTSREERQYKAQLQEQLEHFGIVNAREMASKLIRMNVFKIREGFLPILRHENALEWINSAIRLAQIKINSQNIQVASERANQIVKALKTYSAIQLSDNTKPTDIKETIEVALAIFQSHIKRNVKLVREYEENLPEIEVFPEEISQVWAILISNALYAMVNNGVLTITAKMEMESEPSHERYIKVSIADTGCGIPEENLTKIFEPFFTTKPEGEGAGLGLDICRKILEKHHASIEVYSQPQLTVFTVSLPVKMIE